MSFDLKDYVDVAERQRQLFERYPDARIQVELDDVRNAAGELIAWKCKATVWRTPDDPLPVYDWAVEPVPGKTPYTRDSEAMNASTSAVGRAIVLAGFETKKIASADEVRHRTAAPAPPKEPPPSFQPPSAIFQPKIEETRKALTDELLALAGKLGALTATEESIERNRSSNELGAHVTWLRRQVKTAKQNLETRVPA